MITTPLAPIVTDIIGRTAELKGGAGNNQQARASDVNPIINLVNGQAGVNATSVTQTTSNATGVTANGTAVKVTLFSSATYLATGVTCSFTLTNSSITANSIILPSINFTSTSVTAIEVTSIKPSAGSAIVTIKNIGTGTTDTTITGGAVLSLIVF